MSLWPKQTSRPVTEAVQALPHLTAFCFPTRWSWLTCLWVWFLSFPHSSEARWSSSRRLPAAPYSSWVRMDARRDPTGTPDRFPALGSPMLPLVFALISVCVNTPAVVAKGSDNRHEETKSLQGIPNATVLTGKIFYYPVPVFAFQGKITQYKVMLLNTLLGTILQQTGILLMSKTSSLQLSF